ncbi:MAG TPA: PAS domain S-box protein [Balneolaceae bacterium]|nr:PAS domain S-box protein [Balneolaceae bacterium]
MRRLEEIIDTILNRQQHPYETQQILGKIKSESQRRERLYESILSNTPDLAYIFDLDFKFIYANDATLQMWGISRDEALGKSLAELGYESWHIEMHHKELQEVVKTKKIVRGEVPFNNTEYGRRIYDYIFVPVIGKKGEVEAIAGTSRDITAKKKIEETLEKRIAERTAELQERAAKLRDLTAKLTSAKQQERKRLAAILHDDLQQLLVSAKMHIGFIHSDNSDIDTESADKAKRILDQAIHLARDLTTKLRPPALFEAGLSHALEWLAEDMQERHRLNVEIDKKTVHYSLSDDIKMLLFESIRELLFNIVKYAGTNKALVRIRKDKGFLRVIVQDEGKGFNVDVVRRRSTESFGLFSVLDRLDALGGSVAIASQPGEGTTVELKVPVAPRVSAGGKKASISSDSTALGDDFIDA